MMLSYFAVFLCVFAPLRETVDRKFNSRKDAKAPRLAKPKSEH